MLDTLRPLLISSGLTLPEERLGLLSAFHDMLLVSPETDDAAIDRVAGLLDCFLAGLTHRITHKPPSPERTERHEQRC